jgi:hypothetical protein
MPDQPLPRGLYQRSGSPLLYYQVIVDGKRRRGSTGYGLGQLDEAIAFRNEVKEKLRGNRDADKTVKRAIVRQYSRELHTVRISLAETWARFAAKPSAQAGPKQLKASESYWGDFVKFMADRYPQILHLHDVSHDHTQAYVRQLRTSGRWDDRVVYARGDRTVTNSHKAKHLSNRTINVRHGVCQHVYETLRRDIDAPENPFALIAKPDNEYSERDAFSLDDLRRIAVCAEKTNALVHHIFAVGANTALREGNICLLKWREVGADFIETVQLKTRQPVRIPILLRIPLKVGSDSDPWWTPESSRRLSGRCLRGVHHGGRGTGRNGGSSGAQRRSAFPLLYMVSF